MIQQQDSFAAAMAGRIAEEHAHPLLYATFPLAVAIGIIAVIVLIRWLTSQSAWPYHPGGSRGFLMDEIKRYASIWLPFAIAMVVFRYYVYRFNPELAASPYFYAVFLSVILFRRLARLLPHVKEIGARVDGARARAREAKYGAQP